MLHLFYRGYKPEMLMEACKGCCLVFDRRLELPYQWGHLLCLISPWQYYMLELQCLMHTPLQLTAADSRMKQHPTMTRTNLWCYEIELKEKMYTQESYWMNSVFLFPYMETTNLRFHHPTVQIKDSPKNDVHYEHVWILIIHHTKVLYMFILKFQHKHAVLCRHVFITFICRI